MARTKHTEQQDVTDMYTRLFLCVLDFQFLLFI